MMTLDEAIKHAEEVANKKKREKQKWDKWLESDYDHRAVAERVSCKLCADEHRQLAEWLKELKQLREQEPCKKAVSVQDCINAIENTDCELSPQAWKEIATSIMSLPPVPPVRKKGKWIKIGDRGFGVSDTVICKCSECEYKTEFRGKFDGHSLVIDPKHAHKYCPSCGLEMENAERNIFGKHKEMEAD